MQRKGVIYMKKTALLVLGLLVFVIGILGIFNIWIFAAPLWYAIVKAVVGAVGVFIALKK